MRLQQQLPLTQTSCLDAIHGAHDSGFVLARKSQGGWRETAALPAAEAINEAILYQVNDAYFSVSAFTPFNRRRSENVSDLTCHYVDVDHYKLGTSADQAITQLMNRCDEIGIPSPTWIASSGRGVYAFWVFTKAYHIGLNVRADQRAKRLGGWSYCQSLLVKAFADVGSDPAAKDVSRVLRLPCSINSHNGEEVRYYSVGDTIGNAAQKLTTPLRALLEKPKKPKTEQTTKAKGEARSYTKNLFTLSYARQMDIVKLAVMRGGKFRDCRDRALFSYACAVSINAPTSRHLIEQVQGFVEMRISNHDNKYKDWQKYLGSLIKRYEDSPQSPYDDARTIYRMTNATLIDWLEITPEEQQQLSSIISPEEKARRLTLKRRNEGVKERATYEQGRQEQAAQKRIQAQALLSEGKSVSEIAQVMGIKRQNVYRYLK